MAAPSAESVSGAVPGRPAVPGFDALCRRHGVGVALPGGASTRGLFDRATKAEQIAKFETRHLAETPSVVLKERLKIGDRITVAGAAYTVRDLETDADGALTRHFLAEGHQ